METKEQIKERLKKKYGAELTPNSDFTKLPDEILANAHLYDYYDKVSIQATVEMSRRLKNIIDESGRQMDRLTKILIFFVIIQILIMLI